MIERIRKSIEKQKDLRHIRRLLGVEQMTCCLSDKGIRQCAEYLSYRVQRALFELLNECDDTLTWDEFVWMTRRSQEIRDAAKTVAVTAVKGAAFGGFGDARSEKLDLGKDLHDESIQMAKLFDDEMQNGLIVLLMLRAQIAHHRAMCRDRGDAYALRQYMDDLKTDVSLREELIGELLWSLRRMDFYALWLNGGVHRLLCLHGIAQEKGAMQELTIQRALEE